LGQQRRAEQLPDISDLVAHQAFQETISFGRPWGLPTRDERVYLREFSMNPWIGTIVPGMRKVKEFDATWLSSVLYRAPPTSIARLLVTQRGAKSVASRGQVRRLLRELPVALFVILLFASRSTLDLRTIPLMKDVFPRFNEDARRKQVP
jgi:hypothetical protein